MGKVTPREIMQSFQDCPDQDHHSTNRPPRSVRPSRREPIRYTTETPRTETTDKQERA